MLDRELALLCGVETRVLNQAVQRNIKRFPTDFMFSLTREEIRNISQIVITMGGRKEIKMRLRRLLFHIVFIFSVAVHFGIAYGQDATRVRLKEPRIPPLVENQWTEQQQKLLAPIKNQTGQVINVFSTLVRHPLLYERWMPFAIYILGGQSLSPREREILILRIGWLCQSEYEFGQHTLIGKGVGLTDEEIFRVTKGPDDPGWGRFDAALIRATDELQKDAFITDPTWKVLAEKYDEKQLMDIIFTVGQYNLVSMALNSLGVQREPWVPGFPKAGAAAAQVKKSTLTQGRHPL